MTKAVARSAMGRIEGKTHVMPVRVYIEDTDAGGVVYYANYLKFAERARTEMLRALGEHHSDLVASGQAIAVRHVSADYIRSAVLDDDLDIHTTITEVKGASATMHQIIRRGADDLVDVTVKLVCIDLDTGRAVRLPESARTVMMTCIEG